MLRDASTGEIAAGLGIVLGTFAAIGFAGSRRRQGPPRTESLHPGGAAPAPAEPPTEGVPPPGVKGTSYPGTSFPVAPTGSWVRLEDGDGFDVRNPDRAWATPESAASIMRAMGVFRGFGERFALGSLQPRILDVSKKGGGALPPHKSHHEGRDVDVAFIGGGLPPLALPSLLMAFLQDPNVKAIYLDWNVQRQVWDALDINPELDGDLRSELQYPLAPHSGRTRVRHWPGHRKHIHVRFRA